MSYLSIEFSIFFLAIFFIYWGLYRSIKAQNLFLVLVSYFIVGLLNINFALILLCYTLLNYSFSLALTYAHRWRKLIFISAITCSIINLAVFKYFDFFSGELQAIFHTIGIEFYLPTAELLLPIGISFYTFHCISYLVSLYKKEMHCIKFLDFMLFLSFFPSIVAGPINRAKTFIPQITSEIHLPRSYGSHLPVVRMPRHILEPYRALTLILLAIIKVYWISSAIEQYCVNPIFNQPTHYHSFDLMLGIYAYAVQIYLNFSGYTDLVTSIALLLGFRLPINFNLPYLACNLRDFWQRWHISLSTWIRDYIYFPLGGSRCRFSRTQINVMIAMLLSGLWHGAGTNFILWGALHGFGIIFLNIKDHLQHLWRARYNRSHETERSLIHSVEPSNRRSPSLGRRMLAQLITFHFICLTWLFFRSNTAAEATHYLQAITTQWHDIPLQFNALIWFPALTLLFLTYSYWAKWPHYFMLGLMRLHWSVVPLILIAILYVVITVAPSGIPLFIYGAF